MDQQLLFNFYTYIVVGVIAQSILAWELGTKGWDIALPKNCFRPRVILAILLFVGQVIWQQVAGLDFPIQSARQAWPVLFPIFVFIYARVRLNLLAKSSPRLSSFLRAKKLYYNYAKRLGIPFEKLTDDHFKKAAADSSLHEAEELYTKAIDISLEEDQDRDAAIAKYQLGMLYHIQGRKAEARQLFDDALIILDEYMSDKEAVSTAAGCYYHLGLLAESERNMTDAQKLYKKAYELETSIGELRDAYASEVALERCGGKV